MLLDALQISSLERNKPSAHVNRCLLLIFTRAQSSGQLLGRTGACDQTQKVLFGLGAVWVIHNDSSCESAAHCGRCDHLHLRRVLGVELENGSGSPNETPRQFNALDRVIQRWHREEKIEKRRSRREETRLAPLFKLE